MKMSREMVSTIFRRGEKVRGDHLPELVSLLNQVFDIHD